MYINKNRRVAAVLLSCCLAVAGVYWVVAKKERSHAAPAIFFPEREADADFLLTGNGALVFSASTPAGFRLITVQDSSCNLLDSAGPDSFHPFLYKGRVTCLQDEEGNEQFHPADVELRTLLGGRSVEKIYSFLDGGLLVIKCKMDPQLYLLTGFAAARPPRLQVACRVEATLNGVVYDAQRRCIIVSHDAVLEEVNIDHLHQQVYDAALGGEKLNLFLDSGYLYFVSNDQADVYAVYRLPCGGKHKAATLVRSSTHDLRLPRISGDTLYYIEVINHHYLLKYVGLKNNNTEGCITRSGVVYNYGFTANHQLVYTYSNLNTPRTIRIHIADSLPDREVLPSPRLKDTLACRMVRYNDTASTAFFLYAPHDLNKPKGIVLLIHPGLNADFSPRWDGLIHHLCTQGFQVLAPNYPMSGGEGKAYASRDLSDAVNDLQSWTRWLECTYHLPVYYLSSSSGNLLLEAVLAMPGNHVHAAASLFGLPGMDTDPAQISTPILYVLGKNDPIVACAERLQQLEKSPRRQRTVLVLPNEGHWCRKQASMEVLLAAVLSVFRENR